MYKQFDIKQNQPIPRPSVARKNVTTLVELLHPKQRPQRQSTKREDSFSKMEVGASKYPSGDSSQYRRLSSKPQIPSYQNLSLELQKFQTAHLPKNNSMKIGLPRDVDNIFDQISSNNMRQQDDIFKMFPKLKIPPEEQNLKLKQYTESKESQQETSTGHPTSRDYHSNYWTPCSNNSKTPTNTYKHTNSVRYEKKDLKPFTQREFKQELKQTISTLATTSTAKTSKKVPKHSNSFRNASIFDFQILREVGQGKFSKVLVAKHRTTGFIVAIKKIRKDRIENQKLANQIVREIKITTFLNHPNIISIYGYFDDEQHLYLVQELGCDGQLFKKLQKIQKFSEEAVAFIIKQVIVAVGYLHKNKIYHRDIKPQNIVLAHGNVKLCDLGWSVHSGKNELRSTMCGTPLYASPQQLKGQHYSEKIDLWAIGILAYELYFGSTPFNITLQEELIRIITDDVKFPQGTTATPQFKNFIQSILKKNPTQRLNCSQLLQHPFIVKYKDFQTCEELCSV